jgi:hypothetical protein
MLMNNELQEYYVNALALENMRKNKLLNTNTDKKDLQYKRKELQHINNNINLLQKLILNIDNEVVFYKWLKKYENALKKDIEYKSKLIDLQVNLYGCDYNGF